MAPASITIAGTRAPLAARIDLPAGTPVGFALLAHCLTCPTDQGAAARIARGLLSRGLGVLRLDFAGLGGSAGDGADPSFSADVDDLVRAADHLRTTHTAPALLVGHSRGGAAVIAAAGRIPEVRAVATVGAPSPPQTRADRPAELRRPLLVLHAPDDDVVGYDEARRIAAARPHASLVALDGADHLLTRPADAERVAALITAWALPYLPAAPAADPAPEPGTVVVEETGVGRFTQRIRSGDLRWAADEPVAAGGTGTAPDPYQLLLSALGACTTMTLRLYAERKGWDLRRASVTLTHDRLHAADCTTCDTSTGRLDRIVREIHLDGDLDREQRRRLLAIADRCPVHRTLHSEIVIETDEV